MLLLSEIWNESSLIHLRAFIFKDVDKHPEQNMQHIAKRLDHGDGRPACAARMHPAGRFLKTEPAPLQNHEGLDFGPGERKTSGKELQSATIHSNEAGGRIENRSPEDG